MKNLIIILLAMVLSNLAAAQNMRDVIQLKNGSVIKGTITEQTPPAQLKIQTTDGSIFVYRYDEIDSITREEVKPAASVAAKIPEVEQPKFEEYGGPIGIGIAVGGAGGVIGIPIRAYITRMVAVEAGLFLRPTIIKVDEYYSDPWGTNHSSKTQFKLPLFLAGGFDFFLSERFRPRSGKIVKNGIMFRAGTTIGASYKYPKVTVTYSSPPYYQPTYKETMVDSSYSQTMLTIGWARERFKTAHKKSCYDFELGLGIIKSNGIPSMMGTILDDEDIKVDPVVYFKFHWNFFLK